MGDMHRAWKECFQSLSAEKDRCKIIRLTGSFPPPVSLLKPELFVFLSVLYCLTEGNPDCGPHAKEDMAILLLALIVSGSGHTNLFGWIQRLILSALTQKPDFMLLTIVTDLCSAQTM